MFTKPPKASTLLPSSPKSKDRGIVMANVDMVFRLFTRPANSLPDSYPHEPIKVSNEQFEKMSLL